MGGSAACIPIYLNATEKEIGAWTGDGMSRVPAFKRQTDPRFTLTTPKLQPPFPCSVTLLWPDPNSDVRTCVHTHHRCMLSNKGAGTRGQSRTWQSRALRICLPAATQPCRAPGHLWLHMASRAETHMCSFGKGLSKYFDVLFNPTEGKLYSKRKRQVTIRC